MMEAQLLAQRYELQEQIGMGGMATIYKALDHQTSRIVAIKLLKETLHNETSFVARFQREAKAAASLSDPHIVQVYDYGLSDGTYYISMEYVPGTDLRRYLRVERIVPIATAIRIAREVAQGLAAAHRQLIIHRDIKPQNILLDQNNAAKLTDFGIAHVFQEEGGERLTTVGTTVGTVQYYAPEQARGELPTPAVDVYALGVVLYEMVAGRLPFEAESAIALAMKHLTEPPVPPSRYNAAIPRALEAIILQCLSKRAIDRYPDGAALYNALTRLKRADAAPSPTAALAGLTESTEELPVTKVERTPPRRVLPSTVTPQSVTRMPRRPPRQQRSGAVGCALALIGALIFLVLALLSFFFGQRLPFSASRPAGEPTPTTVAPIAAPTAAPTAASPAKVVVPQLRGVSFERAQQIAQEHNLVVTEHLQASNSPAGTVLRQSPAPGNRVPAGSTVRLIVSSGGGESRPTSTPVPQVATPVPQVGVPNVVGLPVGEAQAALQQVGLQATTEFFFSAGIPTNQVFNQQPDPGTRVASGSVVKLAVSKGPNPAETPTPGPTAAPTAEPTQAPTQAPTLVPQPPISTPAPVPTNTPVPTPPVPTATAVSSPTPTPPTPTPPTPGKKHKP